MSASFSRTLRALDTDRSVALHGIMLIGAALLAAWSAWMVGAHVPVYEAAPARIEVEQASHPVQAPASGRVVAAAMPLGRVVAQGDVLFEVDAEAQRLELAVVRARLAAIGPELAAAREERGARAQAVTDHGQGTAATLAEARARHDEARAAKELAEQELRRARELHAESAISDAELARTEATAAQRRARTEALQAAVQRIAASDHAESSDRRARRESLARVVAELEGEELTVHATIERLEHEIERRTVRASVAGRLADAVPLTSGSIVHEGATLGAIVPEGRLRVVAEYSPTRALGRILAGQPARVRLDGFPWAQHGTVPATVRSVANEVRDGHLRVELEISRGEIAIPLQHGLPGSVEVEVERTTPAILILRAAGKLVE